MVTGKTNSSQSDHRRSSSLQLNNRKSSKEGSYSPLKEGIKNTCLSEYNSKSRSKKSKSNDNFGFDLQEGFKTPRTIEIEAQKDQKMINELAKKYEMSSDDKLKLK